MVVLLALCGLAGAHQITFSHVDIRLESGVTNVTAQLPITALLHEEPSALPTGTTEAMLKAEPLPANIQAALTSLLTARLQLTSTV